MRVVSFFSGVGMLDYGLTLAGFEHVLFCEADPFRREILAKRWPGVPIHDDIRTLTELPKHDIIVGGFPCKGVSSAGKGEGFGHPETALWREMRRLIRLARPRYVLVENVAALTSRHDGRLLGEVLRDLAESGFDAEWDCVPASALGAPHGRDRIFVVAHAQGERGELRTPERERQGGSPSSTPPDASERELREGRDRSGSDEDQAGAGVAPDANRWGRTADTEQDSGTEEPGLEAPLGNDPDRCSRACHNRTGGGNIECVCAPPNSQRGVHGRPRHGDLAGTEGTREGEAPEREWLRTDSPDGGGLASPHPQRSGRRSHERDLSAGEPNAQGQSATDPAKLPQREPSDEAHPEPRGGDARTLTSGGDRFDFGIYQECVERWAGIFGEPPPEPLLRGVDARPAARVVRSRLSALGDGVQVQVAELIGRRILEWEEE